MKSIYITASPGISLPAEFATAVVPDQDIACPPDKAGIALPANPETECIGNHHDTRERHRLSSLFSGFEGISLKGMEETKAQLMSRIESKHVMTLVQCRKLVSVLAGSYRVLEIEGNRVGRYVTMYYDTPDFRSYNEHHNGKKNRFKIRLRHYNSSDETFIEVKKKNNKGQTDKSRMKTTWTMDGFLPEQEDFLHSALPYDCHAFHPVVRTVYDRITLVSEDSPERITLDTGISFNDSRRTVSFPDLVIGEIKYEKGVKNTPALRAIHAMGIRKRSFSKYCIGASLLYDRLKRNHFKENLLFISRLDQQVGVPC